MIKYIMAYLVLSSSTFLPKKPVELMDKTPQIMLDDSMINTATYKKFVNMFLSLKTGYISTGRIYVYINSPGGYLHVFFKIREVMQLIKNQGVQIECHLLNGVSAAASIFQECDRRIVYYNSAYGQHRAMDAYTEKCDFLCVMMDLDRLQTESKNVKMRPEEYRKMLPPGKSVTYWYGESIKFAKLADIYIDKRLVLKKVRK